MAGQRRMNDDARKWVEEAVGSEADAAHVVLQLEIAGCITVKLLKAASRGALEFAKLGPFEIDAILEHQKRAVQPPRRTLQGFKNMLDGDVEEEVLDSVLRLFADQAALADTPERAKLIYNQAKNISRSSTRLIISRETNWVINGLYKANVSTRSVALLYAFDKQTLQPHLLKMPRTRDESIKELRVWEQLHVSGQALPPHLAGPLSLLPLAGSVELGGVENKHGLIMPLYNATLEHVPSPMTYESAVTVGQQLLKALEHMHSSGLCHNDVKEPNVFIDHTGAAFLGDYGSTREIDADADERTVQYLPSECESINLDKSSAACDKVQLAMMLLVRVGKLTLSKEMPTPYSRTCAAWKALDRSELKDFICDLLPGMKSTL